MVNQLDYAEMIDEIDALFTDRPLKEPLAEVLAATDVELHVAAETPEEPVNGAS